VVVVVVANRISIGKRTRKYLRRVTSLHQAIAPQGKRGEERRRERPSIIHVSLDGAWEREVIACVFYVDMQYIKLGVGEWRCYYICMLYGLVLELESPSSLFRTCVRFK
jgi:hypothetical protein